MSYKCFWQVHYCNKLEQAITFARSGFVHYISHAKETCGPDATLLDLPICEYDCGLPTICLLTGRYAPFYQMIFKTD